VKGKKGKVKSEKEGFERGWRKGTRLKKPETRNQEPETVFK